MCDTMFKFLKKVISSKNVYLNCDIFQSTFCNAKYVRFEQKVGGRVSLLV